MLRARVRAAGIGATLQRRTQSVNKFGIGQAVRRVEDRRFLSGAGRFVDDIVLPRQTYGVCVLSPHAHAAIRSIDAAAARAAPGVVLVLTGADVRADKLGGIPPFFMPQDWGGPKGFRTERPVLAVDRVRCVGERVAFVVAETEAQARDAANLVEVDYDPLPAVIDAEAALEASAPRVWEDCPTGNAAVTLALGDRQAAESAFARARHVAKVRLVNNRVTANAIEPRSAVGHYSVADDSYTLYATTQDPHGFRNTLATAVFGI